MSKHREIRASPNRSHAALAGHAVDFAMRG